MLFNHRNGCQKCEVDGEYSRAHHRMSFPNIDAPRRTNETFRRKTQPSHHKDTSVLEDLDIDMIKSFPIADPLHLLHQGVTKQCLMRWTGKIKGYTRKWHKVTTESVSRYLLEANNRMPTDIHRSVRGLEDLCNWKGVDFRTFLMYVGMTALRPTIKNASQDRHDEYEHFLLLCCACTVVSCNVYKDYIPLATNMFRVYVQEYIRIYGRHSISSNVHNLIHITDDLIQNNIDTINQISMKLQNCNRPLEQISRRLIEISQIKTNSLNVEDLNQPIGPVFQPHVEYKISENLFQNNLS